MEFNKAYNREDFVNFVRTEFLPEDYLEDIKGQTFDGTLKYSKTITKIGDCKSLALDVFEIKHSSNNDARVSLSKESFRILSQCSWNDRALIAFVPKDNPANYRISLVCIDRKWDGDKKTKEFSNPRRYSYYLGEGIGTHTPDKYLKASGRVTDFKDLQNRFSVRVLTKAFYSELSDWYAWAIKIIRFPNNINDKSDDAAFNSESAIRLITRLIFVWFLKQKHLIPDEFFDKHYISTNLLKDFDPNLQTGLFLEKSLESKYYKAILQNLFFAMLNSPITPEGKDTISERRFSKGRQDFDNNKLMRYKDKFKNPDLFIDIANKTVPFLNGGLFDCLDEKDKDLYYDGFSEREVVQNALIVPDYLFFGETVGKNIDLSGYYGDVKKKRVNTIGIIDILKRYNFTVEENTPADQEISLDPELLGKVFENLLASYNPETQSTARKQTGSFYTPREIVQYMVDESLVAHLKRTVGDEYEEEYRKLMRYTDEEINLAKDRKTAIMHSLYNCKIFDPACGSGAFPMGALQQMVHILSQLDPDNEQWKNLLMKNAISETSEAYQNATDEERKEIVMDIERSFNDDINRPDYARKLYLIEHCIYGVDIQSIAVQISKLRFFISLVVDQITNDNPVNNFGIRPLPNLEAKFVAANTLIGLKKNETTLFDSEAIQALQDEMMVANHNIFGAKTHKTKMKYRKRIAELRLKIANLLKDSGVVGNEEAEQMSGWDMFDQNASSPFFDPEWMFGLSSNNGGYFDIVIGNPPYIDSETMTNIGLSGERDYITSSYSFISGNWDIYMAFFEKGLSISKDILCFITPDKWLSKPFGKKFRKECMMPKMIQITHCGNTIFEGATVDAIISLFVLESHVLSARKYDKEKKIRKVIDVAKSIIKEPYYIDCFFSDEYSNIQLIEKNCHYKLSQIVICENACATSDAYLLSDIIMNNNKPDFKSEEIVINTGTINKWVNKWGAKEMTYLGTKYLYPTVKISDFKNTSGRTYIKRAIASKIILKGLNLLDACIDFEGHIIPGKTTLVICSESASLLKVLCAILNSSLIFKYIKIKHSSSSYCGAITFSPDMINNLPIPESIHILQEPIIALVDTILTAKHNNPNADITVEEMAIDRLVYQLYGLTDEEVAIIEGK